MRPLRAGSDTKVLAASGGQVPISSLKTGDKVQAQDTATGKRDTQTVTAVMVNHDTDLYDLTVKTSHGTSVVHTTSHHLFWDKTRNTWTTAAGLRPGDTLLTADGATATAEGGATPATTTGWMWDLTVSNNHDFYVVAGSTAVLVHNCPTVSGDEPSTGGFTFWRNVKQFPNEVPQVKRDGILYGNTNNIAGGGADPSGPSVSGRVGAVPSFIDPKHIVYYSTNVEPSGVSYPGGPNTAGFVNWYPSTPGAELTPDGESAFIPVQIVGGGASGG